MSSEQDIYALAGKILKVVETKEEKIRKTCILCVEGLYADNIGHKQWYLEQILLVLSATIKVNTGPEWDPGVPPGDVNVI